MTAANTVTLTLTKVKETKGTVVFGNDADDAAVSRIYITKAAVEKLGNPESVSLNIVAK